MDYIEEGIDFCTKHYQKEFSVGQLVKLRPNDTNNNVWYARLGSKRHRTGLVKITLDMVGLVVSGGEQGTVYTTYKVLFQERVVNMPTSKLVKI